MLTNMLLHKFPTDHNYPFLQNCLQNSHDVFYQSPPSTSTASFYSEGPPRFGTFDFGSIMIKEESSPNSDGPRRVVGRLRMPPAPPKLKLCEVCGHSGATTHYGGTVCGGCKIFFSRTVQSRKGFVCERGGQCPMNAGKRAKCRACRFQLCLKAHMSPEEVGRLRDMRLGDYAPIVKKESTVVGYFDESSQPPTSLRDCTSQIMSFIDVYNCGNDEFEVLRAFVNSERNCENSAANKYASFFPMKCNASMSIQSAIEFPMPICEKIPMDYMRKTFLQDPKNSMKLYWCRNVLHFLEWASGIEDLGHFSQQEKMLLVAENFLSIACLTSFYGFLKLQHEQFEQSTEDGRVPSPCSMEWFAEFSKLSPDAEISIHRAISEIMEPMDSLDVSMEELVLLKFIMLFTEPSSSKSSTDSYRIRCYRLKYCELLRKYIMAQIPDPEKRIARIAELLKIVESVRNTATYLDKWMTMFYTSNTCQMNDVLVYDFHVRTYHNGANLPNLCFPPNGLPIKREI
ncbi:hypothetical protein L5515_012659 [Caenorhabditis briggsae]|uniref:Nuclear receptor domain-containing protein n=1 Tax=Caenorhabditis briggsae TaxID=6238 RepID=A0AAE9JGR1_CAEBR|nr:hypothetical protein L5515_012659 [Caenorhabditis briggsae]